MDKAYVGWFNSLLHQYPIFPKGRPPNDNERHIYYFMGILR